MSTVPAYAERMSYRDRVQVVETYSRFIPGETVHREMFACPHCRTQRETPAVNETFVCVACDLHMNADVSYLHVWRPLNLGRLAEPIPVYALATAAE